jgi:hypothetical protein
LTILNCDILLPPSGWVSRGTPNFVHKAIFHEIGISSDLILGAKWLLSTAASNIVLLYLPILIGVIIEEILDHVLSQGPEL